MSNNLLAIILGDVLVNKRITYKSLCALAIADAIIHQYDGVFNIKPFMKKWFDYYPNIEKPQELVGWCSSNLPHMLIDDIETLSSFNICGAVVGLYSNSTTEARTLIFNACPGAKTHVIGDAMAMSEAFYLMHNSYEYDTLNTRIKYDYYRDHKNGIGYQIINNALKVTSIEDIANISDSPSVIHLLYSLLFVHLNDIPDELYDECWDNLTDTIKSTIIDFEQISNGRQQD